MELYYGKKMNPGWGILFLLSTQMIGYGFAGLFRDILVRPPKIYYPGVLPNVSLFNAMHKNPSVTKNSIRFFAYVAVATFIYPMVPWLYLSYAQLAAPALLHGTRQLDRIYHGIWILRFWYARPDS